MAVLWTRFFWLIPVFLVGEACNQPLVSSSEEKIYGGYQSDADAWPNVVAISIGSGQKRALCSGTLIDPLLVTLAGHCVEDYVSLPNASDYFTVIFGNSMHSSNTAQVEQVRLFPDYEGAGATDIAYLRLKSPVHDVALTKLLTDPDEISILLAKDYPVTLVGFGRTEKGSVGIKHEVQTKIHRNRPGEALYIGEYDETTGRFSGKDSCHGDSGGPVFGKLPSGEWRVYGIVSSSGAVNPLTGRPLGCGTIGAYARIYDGICWIQQDSGIIFADAKSNCPGINTKRLKLLIERERSYIASSLDITKVGLCFGDKVSCETTQQIDIAFSKTDNSDPNMNVFFTNTNLAQQISAGAAVTLLGFNQGALSSAQPLQIQSAY